MIAPTDNDVHLKMQWAHHHFTELQEALTAFIKSNPYGILIERDPDTREMVYSIANDAAIPAELALIAGDALQNARSALDYLACRLVIANHGTINGKTGFPILDKALTSPHEEELFARKVKGMGEKAKDLIRQIKPYKGGNDVLWRLHRLNNISKHRLLFTVGAILTNWGITQHLDATNAPLDVMEKLGRAYVSDEVWADIRRASFPLKAGDVLLRDFPDAKPNKNIKFEVQIAINETGICEGEPLSVVVFDSINRAGQVIRAFAGMH